MTKERIVGCRIPYEFFGTRGAGQSDKGPGEDHFETCSYDLALQDAGIENFNVVQYTSVIPPEAVEVDEEKARSLFHHGAVLECIMAKTNGVKGEHITAGVGRMKVWQKSPRGKTGALVGGFAAEYEGHASVKKAESLLHEDLMGIFDRRYTQRTHACGDFEFVIQDLVVDENYGTVLAAFCFVTYIVPVVEVAR